MTFMVPLPAPVREYLRHNTHPGLQLDKYVASWDPRGDGKLSESVQRPAVNAVVELSQEPPPTLDFLDLYQRHCRTLEAVRARTFEAVTVAPVAIHLSRASALENAGICLHPIYGFAFFPGSGVKGLAHAYACEIWLASRPTESREQDWRTICRIFGWAPSKWLEELAKRHGVEMPKKSQSGTIVFHEAWPVRWPKLRGDIVNCHHRQYYGADDSPAGSMDPGDWELPVPIAFPVIAPGQRFLFGCGLRRTDGSRDDLQFALQWLAGALEHAGAGAKTVAGYGGFAVVREAEQADQQIRDATWEAARSNDRLVSEPYELELITPAFVGGLNPDDPSRAPVECALRNASLRGQLRAWWRSMHVAHLKPADLRYLESVIWGNTETSGAVRVTLEPVAEQSTPLPFDRKSIIESAKIPRPTNNKTTFGLTYHSYGMDESRGRRWYLPAGTCGRIVLTVRSARVKWMKEQTEIGLTAAQILSQAQLALRLFAEFGGLGAKSRKGFGSVRLDDVPPLDLAEAQREAAEFRDRTQAPAARRVPHSVSLDELLPVVDIETPWRDYWLVLDRLGMAAQQFAQVRKHRRSKKALGLPRNVRPPYQDSFAAPEHVEDTDRHASPIHYRIRLLPDGRYAVRIAAFPAADLPDMETSRRYLQGAVEEIAQNFRLLTEQFGELGRRPPQKFTAPPVIQLPKPGDRVKAKLLPEKTKKGGWTALHEPTKLAGPIQNSPDVPATHQPGDEVMLKIAFCNPQQIAFKYDVGDPRSSQSKKK